MLSSATSTPRGGRTKPNALLCSGENAQDSRDAEVARSAAEQEHYLYNDKAQASPSTTCTLYHSQDGMVHVSHQHIAGRSDRDSILRTQDACWHVRPSDTGFQSHTSHCHAQAWRGNSRNKQLISLNNLMTTPTTKAKERVTYISSSPCHTQEFSFNHQGQKLPQCNAYLVTDTSARTFTTIFTRRITRTRPYHNMNGQQSKELPPCHKHFLQKTAAHDLLSPPLLPTSVSAKSAITSVSDRLRRHAGLIRTPTAVQAVLALSWRFSLKRRTRTHATAPAPRFYSNKKILQTHAGSCCAKMSEELIRSVTLPCQDYRLLAVLHLAIPAPRGNPPVHGQLRNTRLGPHRHRFIIQGYSRVAIEQSCTGHRSQEPHPCYAFERFEGYQEISKVRAVFDSFVGHRECCDECRRRVVLERLSNDHLQRWRFILSA